MDLSDAVLREILAADGSSEVRIDANGERSVPRLRPVDNLPKPLALTDAVNTDHKFGKGRWLVITGGTSGVGLAIASSAIRYHKLNVLLLSRSNMKDDLFDEV